MRGLKPTGPIYAYDNEEVAPFTGAWIETTRKLEGAGVSTVAPFTGAWIETDKQQEQQNQIDVAPFTGAWIETQCRPRLAKGNWSHPSRVRGLKPHLLGTLPQAQTVAPFTGAWIETASHSTAG